jgi:hypothetical protein
MRRTVRDLVLILLASLVVTGARAAFICETVSSKCLPRLLEISAGIDDSKNATGESYTQGRNTRPVKRITSSPVYSCGVEFAQRHSDFFLLFDLPTYLFGSTFYFSSLCNKAPPLT